MKRLTIAVPDGFSEAGRTQTTPRSMRMKGKLSAKDAAQLAAYYTHEGWVLVPRQWQPVNGDIGANGSSRNGFAPANGTGKVTMHGNGGGCVGCALSDASLFFASARAKAKANEFLTIDPTNYPVQKNATTP